MRFAASSTVTRRIGARLSRWPTRTPAASSATRPTTTPGGSIEAAGLKGHRIGSARVSELHANFIVTDRGGLAADVRALGDHVQATVAERFGVDLRYEIEFVGDWPEAGE